MKFYKIVNLRTLEEKALGLYDSMPKVVLRATLIADLSKYRKSDYILCENNKINLNLDLIIQLLGKFENLKEMQEFIDRIKEKKLLTK